MPSIFGWIASFCFFVCGAPQAYKSFQEKNSDGMSSLTLFFYMSGELSLLIATFLQTPENYALLSGTAFNIVCLCIVLRYKFTKKEETSNLGLIPMPTNLAKTA
jgi:uncharacterized protein with PQ loop repeat